jgi:hypothetical protein
VVKIEDEIRRRAVSNDLRLASMCKRSLEGDGMPLALKHRNHDERNRVVD